MSTAILLSGGGALGAFQAGVLASLQDAIDAGTLARPEHMVGISVGALNATLAAINHHDWGWVANHWYKNVRRPEDIATRKNTVTRIALGLLRGRFDGLVDPSPLWRMRDRHISIDALRQSPITAHAGAVNLNTGALVYRTPVHADFLDHLMASAAIPGVFPVVQIDGEPWVDGGVVEVAPATRCIELGADRIIAILCQPASIQREPIDARDPWALAERLMDIATIASLEKDVRAIESVNRRIEDVENMAWERARVMGHGPDKVMEYLPLDMSVAGLTGKRHVRVDIIRPPEPLGYTTGAFAEADIAAALEMGREAGRGMGGAKP
jgi:NTE family protein